LKPKGLRPLSLAARSHSINDIQFVPTVLWFDFIENIILLLITYKGGTSPHLVAVLDSSENLKALHNAATTAD
jgi:hypothetical protein